MIVAVWVEVGDAAYVVDGWEYALLLLSAYLTSRKRRGMNTRRRIGGYGCCSSTAQSQSDLGCKGQSK